MWTLREFEDCSWDGERYLFIVYCKNESEVTTQQHLDERESDDMQIHIANRMAK
jgi:type IV secretory pathway ATPase VirB11/archaellum biosynthesis ATPase